MLLKHWSQTGSIADDWSIVVAKSLMGMGAWAEGGRGGEVQAWVVAMIGEEG